MGVVVGVKFAGQFAQVIGDGMRFILGSGGGHDFGVLVQTAHQSFFMLLDQLVQMGQSRCGLPLPAVFRQLAQDAAYPGVGVLDVVDRIVVALG